jgi:hypothetical protein
LGRKHPRQTKPAHIKILYSLSSTRLTTHPFGHFYSRNVAEWNNRER